MTQRVLFVNLTFPPQARGGAGRVVQDHVDAMLHEGSYTPCGVFCTLEGGVTPDRHESWLYRGVPVFAAACPWREDLDRLTSRDDMAAPFAAFVDRVRPDIVHFHCIQRMGLELLDVCTARGIPTVLTMHDGWWVADHLFMTDLDNRPAVYDFNAGEPAEAQPRMAALQAAIAKFDVVLTVSEKFRDILAATGLSDRIEVNANGVWPARPPAPGPDPAGQSAADALPGKGTDKLRLLYLGGVDRRKGYHFLRAAVRQAGLRNTHVTVVDHARRTGFSRPGQWGSTEIETIGHMPPDVVRDRMRQSHAVIVPSLWPESFNLVSREAAATGCWVLATDLGAAADHVREGENGFVLPVENANRLIRILRKMDHDPKRYRQPPAPTEALRTPEGQYAELMHFYARLPQRAEANAEGG